MGNFFKKNRTWIIILVIVAVVVAVFIVRGRQAPDTASQFQTAALERGNLTATIGATGTVRAKQTAILVWQAAGTVDTVNVKVGDNIPDGFVMAYLSKTSLPQSVIMAEADLASAQAELDELLNSDTARAQSVIALREAQVAYDKANNWRKELNGKIRVKRIIYKTFYGQTVPILKEYKQHPDETTIAKADEDLALKKAKLDDAQREYDRLTSGNTAEIAAAQARVDAAQATLNLARVIAPFGGIVTDSYPLPGDQVGAGATAYRIDDLSSLLVDVEVSEVDINSVKVGQPATLSFDAILNETYHGEVVEVASVGTNTSGVVNFTVTIELTDADEFVKPGMTAAVNVVVKQENDVLLIPNRAVRLVDTKRVVYVLVNGEPQPVNVELGSTSGIDSVLIAGDLQEGDSIILNPPSVNGGPFGG